MASVIGQAQYRERWRRVARVPAGLLFVIYQRSGVHLVLGAMVLGLVIGVAGHITRARWLIVLGIAIIGIVSVLFSVLLISETS
jgi:hypothetical protein